MKIDFLLELDGGGMKGLFSCYFMKMFCEMAGIPGNEIWKYVKIIGGSSIGAIMGAAYANGKSPDDLIDFFITYGPKIFTSFYGTPMPAARKTSLFTGALIGFANNFANGESFYGDNASVQDGSLPNKVLSAQLQAVFGTTTMSQLKTNTLLTSITKTKVTDNQNLAYDYKPVIISNLALPGLVGQNYLVWESVLASGSAPFYLPPATITGVDANIKFIDGGVAVNNSMGYIMAYNNIIDNIKETYPDRICSLSVGCGLGTVGFYDPVVTTLSGPKVGASISDNIGYLQQMLDVAANGSQEAFANQWASLGKYGLRFNGAEFINYRFNTVYDLKQNTELDNSGDTFNDYMKSAAEAQFKADKMKIQGFIQKLQQT